jgi:hypothetical protein
MTISQESQNISSYNEDFRNKVGNPSGSQEWGDWCLHIPSFTRSVNSDTTTWDRYREVTYPSDEDINDIISTFNEYYDGINMVTLPEGDYWVKTIYKDTLHLYISPDWHGAWFYAYEKMPTISVYSQSEKRYEPIEGIDSLVLIENLDEYDSIMPQFAYFNELYSENHFEQRTIEYNGIYYVGFDFYADGFIEGGGDDYFIMNVVERDYIYRDMIIMLIPAYKLGQEEVYDEKRVMCEDLSNNHDFDFNDLVYDVAIVKLDDVLKTKITVQAVGTNQSIIIATKEAHELFGTQEAIINTNPSMPRREPQSFYIDEVIEDIRDIEVSTFYNNKIYFLGNEKGEPTQRICVDTNTKWGNEGYVFWITYPRFKEWVSDPSVTDWEKYCNTELVFK